MAKNETSYAVPSRSNDELAMPNINKIVEREVARLTKELIEDTKELINMGTSYETIGYVEEENQDVQVHDFMKEQLNGLKIAIQSILNKGNPSKLNEYSFLEYLNLFSLVYNNGVANLTISVDVPNYDIGEIEAIEVSREAGGDSNA